MAMSASARSSLRKHQSDRLDRFYKALVADGKRKLEEACVEAGTTVEEYRANNERVLAEMAQERITAREQREAEFDEWFNSND
jgi:hypothetical protein